MRSPSPVRASVCLPPHATCRTPCRDSTRWGQLWLASWWAERPSRSSALSPKVKTSPLSETYQIHNNSMVFLFMLMNSIDWQVPHLWPELSAWIHMRPTEWVVPILSLQAIRHDCHSPNQADQQSYHPKETACHPLKYADLLFNCINAFAFIIVGLYLLWWRICCISMLPVSAAEVWPPAESNLIGA